MASWPASLPQKPAGRTWSGGAQNNQVAFEPDVGDDIVRRRGSAVAFEYSGRFSALTLTQVNTFKTFFHTTLSDGTATFTWTDPIYGDSGTWRIKGQYAIAEVAHDGTSDLFDLSLTMVRQAE